MGKHSARKLYFLFAAYTFLAVGIIAVVTAVLQMESIRQQAERDAAVGVAVALAPVLGLEAGDLNPEALASYREAASSLLSDQVRTIRLWDKDERLLAATGDDRAAPLDPDLLAGATEGAAAVFKARAPTGDVLASYLPLPSGAVVEIQQTYVPVAASVASSRRVLTIVTVAVTAVLLILLQTIVWAATRGMRSEYDRLLYLYRNGQAMRSSLDLTDVLEQLARDAALYVHAQLGLVTLLDEQSKDLILKASFDRERDTTAQHHRKVDEWSMRRCAATGETAQVQEAYVSYGSLLGYDSPEGGPKCTVSVPIPSREGPIGVVMVVRSQAQGKLKPSELQMLEDMAAQAALAVEQASLFGKVRSYAHEVELSYDSTLKVLMAALDTKDAVTQGHSERVSRLTVTLAKEMGIPQEKLVDIERGALLHDVGKIGVPDAVLRKPDSLDDDEWEAMKKHPMLAGLMVSKVGFLEGAIPILLYHHERYDGSGYPFGLKGEAIPLDARIFTVVDSFDAMTSDRPYRDAIHPDEALREIQRNAGIQFDPQVVKAFARVVARMQPMPEEAA